MTEATLPPEAVPGYRPVTPTIPDRGGETVVVAEPATPEATAATPAVTPPAEVAPWVAQRSAEVAVRRNEVSATEALVNQVKFMFGGERSASPSRVAQMREQVQAVAERSPLFGEVGGRYQRVREASERMVGEISPENRQELVQIAETILRTGGNITRENLETWKALRRPGVGERLAAVLARVEVATEAENQINAELGAVPDRAITYEQQAMVDALSNRAEFMALGSEIATDVGSRVGGNGRVDYGYGLRMVLEDQRSRVVAMGNRQRGELAAIHRARASLLQRFPDQADRINEAHAQHIAQATESRAVRETPPPAVVAGPEAYDRLNAQMDKFVWSRPEHRARLMQELGAVQVRNEETGETTWTLRRGSLGEQMVQQMENARSAQQKFEATLEASRDNPMVGDLLVYRGHEAYNQTQLSRALESRVMQRVETARAAQLKQAKLELNRTLAKLSDNGFREAYFKTLGAITGGQEIAGRQANLNERNALMQRRVALYEEINRLTVKKARTSSNRPAGAARSAEPAETRPAATPAPGERVEPGQSELDAARPPLPADARARREEEDEESDPAVVEAAAPLEPAVVAAPETVVEPAAVTPSEEREEDETDVAVDPGYMPVTPTIPPGPVAAPAPPSTAVIDARFLPDRDEEEVAGGGSPGANEPASDDELAAAAPTGPIRGAEVDEAVAAETQATENEAGRPASDDELAAEAAPAGSDVQGPFMDDELAAAAPPITSGEPEPVEAVMESTAPEDLRVEDGTVEENGEGGWWSRGRVGNGPARRREEAEDLGGEDDPEDYRDRKQNGRSRHRGGAGQDQEWWNQVGNRGR